MTMGQVINSGIKKILQSPNKKTLMASIAVLRYRSLIGESRSVFNRPAAYAFLGRVCRFFMLSRNQI